MGCYVFMYFVLELFVYFFIIWDEYYVNLEKWKFNIV